MKVINLFSENILVLKIFDTIILFHIKIITLDHEVLCLKEKFGSTLKPQKYIQCLTIAIVLELH